MTSKRGNFFNQVSVEGDGTGDFTVSMALVGRIRTSQVALTISPEEKSGMGRTFHTMTGEELELFMTKMWDAGIRPTGFREPATAPTYAVTPPPTHQEAFFAGKLEAVTEHLNDMRKMVGLLPRPSDHVEFPGDLPMTGRGGTI